MTRIDSQNDLLCRIDDSCFRVEGESVEKSTIRILKVGDKFILSDVKELCRRFGLEWNFVSSRNSKTISYNRASRKLSLLILVLGSRYLLRVAIVGIFVLNM